MEGAVTGSWEGIRVNALATHPHQDLVYAADTHHRIRQYNFQDHSSSTVLVEMTYILVTCIVIHLRYSITLCIPVAIACVWELSLIHI